MADGAGAGAGAAADGAGASWAWVAGRKRSGATATFWAVEETPTTGRRTSSEISATRIGVAAALSRVPGPQSRETVYEVTAEATLATISVCTEIVDPPRPAGRPAGAVWDP